MYVYMCISHDAGLNYVISFPYIFPVPCFFFPFVRERGSQFPVRILGKVLAELNAQQAHPSGAWQNDRVGNDRETFPERHGVRRVHESDGSCAWHWLSTHGPLGIAPLFFKTRFILITAASYWENLPETTINHGLVGDEITYFRIFGTIQQNRWVAFLVSYMNVGWD